MLIACVHCSCANRVPDDRLADDPVCGRCGQALLPGEPVVLTETNFEVVAGKTELPLVVDFWASWCGPCRMMAPHFAQAARELKGRVLFAKVDSDANPQLAARFAIRSLPTVVRVQRGREAARLSGARPASDLVQFALP